MEDNCIKGLKKENLSLRRGNFLNCKAGISNLYLFAIVIIISLTSIIIGFFNSLVIAQTICDLIEKPPDLSAILIGLLLLLILTPSSIFFNTCLLSYSFSIGRLTSYSLITFNTLGCTLMLISAIRNPILIFVFNSIINIITFVMAKKAWSNSISLKWLKNWSIYYGVVGGTSFYGMNLKNAVFDGADLRNTDLREANLTHTSFVGAKNLELARIKGTILEDKRVRDLLIEPKNNQIIDFSKANFVGANLRGANLERKIFIEAKFQGATLQNANLAAADLTGVNAIDTDFSDAILHDICIQDWNVSKKTNFKNVQCRRVFLKQNQQEPKPDSGFFADGEFEKWITDVSDTIDLILQNGLNLRSLAFALTQVSIDYEDTQLTVESLAHKGDGVVVVKIGVQQTQESLVSTSKATIHKAITQEYADAQQAIIAGYELLLRAKDEEIARGMVRFEALEANMRGLIGCLAQPKQLSSAIFNTYIAGGDIVEGSKNQAGGNIDNSDRSNNTNISTNIDGGISSTNSVVNLGSVGGSITNSVNQAPDLAEFITGLQILKTVIQEDATLKNAPRAQVLEEIHVLEKEAPKDDKDRDKSLISEAIKKLEFFADLVTDGSKLAQACQTYLPTFAKFFGL